MARTLDDHQLRIPAARLLRQPVQLKCPPRVIKTHNFILRPVNDEHRTRVALEKLIGILVDDRSRVIPPERHRPALNLRRNIGRVKVREHHPSFPRIIRDAERREEQDQLLHFLRVSRRGHAAHESALRAAHKDDFAAPAVPKSVRRHRLKVPDLREDRHFPRVAVASAAQAASAEVERVNRIPRFREQLRVRRDSLLISHEAVAYDDRAVPIRPLRDKFGPPNRQFLSLRLKRFSCKLHAHSSHRQYQYMP